MLVLSLRQLENAVSPADRLPHFVIESLHAPEKPTPI
jgi:hypothetical protein